MAKTTVSAPYNTGGNPNITLGMEIGENQGALSRFFLDGVLFHETTDNLIALDLSNMVLPGKRLRIRCIVKDIQDDTDDSSVIFGLRGGQNDFLSDLKNKITPSGGFIVYTYTISFF